jgi:predicted nuclease with TOPRIM domain
MKKVKSYNNFVNESLITEIIDPITLTFAIAGIGIAFGPEIMKAYRSRKISNADLKDLTKMLSKAKAKAKKYERQGLDHDSAEAQSEVDHIEARIDDLRGEMSNHDEIIKDFEKDKKTHKELEQELKGVDPEVLRKALRNAKKEASKLK